MTEAQIKAKALVDKYKPLFDFTVSKSSEQAYINSIQRINKSAIECALICVDTILNNQMSMRVFYDNIEIVENVKFWQEVKQEITNYK